MNPIGLGFSKPMDTMGIRSRILLFQLIVVGSVLMMAAIVYITIRSTTYYMQRVEWANNQLEAVTALTVNANRYSEQIAEFLLIGEPERPDYDSARAELEAGFDELERLTRGEAEFLAGTRNKRTVGTKSSVSRGCARFSEKSPRPPPMQSICAARGARRMQSVSFAVTSRTVSTPSSKTSWRPRGATKRKKSAGPRCMRKHCGDA
ncbi:hypothetical protein AJ88_21005 [Mesorhizobium amorphae CCBAU 01583]|nr:hypothetical protein AJ88_21005 [Mesorhizobium amorphae CCBAU 01583]